MERRESAEEILTSFVRVWGEEVLEDGEDADLTLRRRFGGSGVISEDDTSGVSPTSSLPDPLYLLGLRELVIVGQSASWTWTESSV